MTTPGTELSYPRPPTVMLCLGVGVRTSVAIYMKQLIMSNDKLSVIHSTTKSCWGWLHSKTPTVAIESGKPSYFGDKRRALEQKRTEINKTP